MDAFDIVLHSPDNIAPVGVLHPSKFHLERKSPGQFVEDLGRTDRVHEVEEVVSEGLFEGEPDTHSLSALEKFQNFASECCSTSRRSGDFVTVSCRARLCTSAYGELAPGAILFFALA